MSNHEDLPELSSYDKRELDLEVEAIQERTTRDEVFRRRMETNGFHIASVPETRPPILSRLIGFVMHQSVKYRRGDV